MLLHFVLTSNLFLLFAVSEPLFQKLKQFLSLKGCCLNFITGKDLFRQLFFHLLKLDDFFLDGSFCNQFVYRHNIFLPNTMCTVCRLIFNSNIPPWIVMDDDIRAGQVQAGSTCFQGNTDVSSRLNCSTICARCSFFVLPCRTKQLMLSSCRRAVRISIIEVNWENSRILWPDSTAL